MCIYVAIEITTNYNRSNVRDNGVKGTIYSLEGVEGETSGLVVIWSKESRYAFESLGVTEEERKRSHRAMKSQKDSYFICRPRVVGEKKAIAREHCW